MQIVATPEGVYISKQSRRKMPKPAKSLEALKRSALADKAVAGASEATPSGEQFLIEGVAPNGKSE